MATYDIKFQMRISTELAERLDAYRGKQPGVPSRASVIRWFIEQALDKAEATETSQKDTPPTEKPTPSS